MYVCMYVCMCVYIYIYIYIYIERERERERENFIHSAVPMQAGEVSSAVTVK